MVSLGWASTTDGCRLAGTPAPSLYGRRRCTLRTDEAEVAGRPGQHARSVLQVDVEAATEVLVRGRVVERGEAGGVVSPVIHPEHVESRRRHGPVAGEADDEPCPLAPPRGYDVVAPGALAGLVDDRPPRPVQASPRPLLSKVVTLHFQVFTFHRRKCSVFERCRHKALVNRLFGF